LVGYDKIYITYEFNTFNCSSFEWIYKLFFEDKKKVINRELGKYITPLALAVWIMDDGWWVGYGIRLSTNVFSYVEVKILCDILKENFKLDTTIQKLSKPKKYISIVDKYSIYIRVNSIEKLRNTVVPFIHPFMLYKLGIKKRIIINTFIFYILVI
jgi:ubiquinol-cytochrome c reductase cytochrome b subunit